jgi:hypothetical protein
LLCRAGWLSEIVTKTWERLEYYVFFWVCSALNVVNLGLDPLIGAIPAYVVHSHTPLC